MKKKVIVYGIGKFYREMKEQIYEMYEVVAMVDKRADEFEGVRLFRDVLDIHYDAVLIMIMDMRICYEIVDILVKEYSIPCEKIVLGLNLKFDKKWDFLEVNAKGQIILKKNGISIATENIDAYNNISEIFCDNCYSYFLSDNSEEVVLDIGMNIGGAALYFANKKNVVKVYGYEPFLDTFIQAKENLMMNGFDGTEKVECLPYGISNRNEIKHIVYNKNMTCGQSTDMEANEKARYNYQEWNLISADDDKMVEVEVKDIRDVLQNIYKNHKKENVVLKIDCEGEEFKIMERLEEADLFNRINVIMLEWHYDIEEKLLCILRRNQYMYINFNNGNSVGGFIYAFRRK